MNHEGICESSSVEAEGAIRVVIFVSPTYLILIFTLYVVACHVGDWVEVQCDYTPGQCSEGGTGVVVATVGGIALTQTTTPPFHLR
jgi:hypothetical protein